MLRRLRLFRFLRTSLAISLSVIRYAWLLARARVPGIRPSARAWDRAHARTGRTIYRLATGLGGAYVKFGQILGTRGDVLPEALVAPLRGLHDRVPARPLSRLRRHVERELGTSIDEVFAQVTEGSLAAASLAQVHRARLHTGEEVVLKIQYPEAGRLFPGDLGNMRRGVRAVRLLHRRLDLRPLADELARFVCLELDFAREADSTERIAERFASDATVRIPRLFRQLCSDRLLVLEYLDGDRLTDLDGLRAKKVDLPALAERIAALYGAMIFEHGFFQADPHPGNMLILSDGTLALLDFGLTKELPDGFAAHIAAMIAAALANDDEAFRRAAGDAGFSLDAGADELAAVVRMLVGGSGGGPRKLLDALDAGALRGAPSHFALIVRALALLTGLTSSLAPGRQVVATMMSRALAPHLVAAVPGA